LSLHNGSKKTVKWIRRKRTVNVPVVNVSNVIVQIAKKAIASVKPVFVKSVLVVNIEKDWSPLNLLQDTAK